MKKFKSIKPSRALYLSLAVLLAALNLTILAGHSEASSLTNTYLRETRMKSGQAAELRVAFKTAAGDTSTGFTIDMNGNDAGSAWTSQTGVVKNGALSVANVVGCDVSAVADNGGSPTATGSSTGTITVSGLSALTASTEYCYDITVASTHDVVTNPTAGHEGEYHPTITDTASNSTTTAVRVISNDQVVVSATVPPSFNFALSGSTDSLGTLSAGAVAASTSNVTATVNTNAKNGWMIWAAGSGGLTSAQAGGYSISATSPGSADTLSAGTEGYVLGVTSITQGTGSGTASAGNYASNGTTTGSGVDGTYRQVVSSNGTAINAIVPVKELAAINGGTPAGSDYTDTITLIGAGNF